MWVDFHVHTRWSHDSMSSPRSIVRAALKRGLSAIAITDHNEIEGAYEVLEEARRLSEEFYVIVGEEIKTVKGDLTGLYLTEKIPKGLSVEETIDLIREQGGIIVVPHPFDRRWRGALRDYTFKIADKVDFIEVVNGRTPRWNNEKAKQFAKTWGIPGIGGSDAHSSAEVGKVRTLVSELRNGKIVPVKIEEKAWPPILFGIVYSFLSKVKRL